MKKPLHEIALTRRLVGDGAMGTQLMLAGLESGNCGEAWNLTHPERVRAIQQRYADAGADCIITNTFGGSRIMLRRHGHEKDLAEINRAGARITREAFGGKPGFVRVDEADRFDRFFFICHSPRGELTAPTGRSDIHVWAGREMAATVVRLGLQDWVFEKIAS